MSEISLSRREHVMRFKATMKISRSEKGYNRRENISRREKFQSLWNLIHAVKIFHPVKKVTVSVEKIHSCRVNILLVFPMQISEI